MKKYNLTENTKQLRFRTNVESLILGSDIVILTSQSYESFGLVIIEAFARFKPVVATNTGGIPEVMMKWNREFCIEKNDEDTFSKCILNILSDDRIYRSLSMSAYKAYETHFQAKQMALAYHTLISEGSSV